MSPYTSVVDLMVDNSHYCHETTTLQVLLAREFGALCPLK